MSSRLLLVAGAVSYNYLIYPAMGDSHHDEQDPESEDIANIVIRTGNADLISQMLDAAAPRHGISVLGPRLQPPTSNCLKHNASCVCDLVVDGSAPDVEPRYSVKQTRRIGKPPVWHCPDLNNVQLAPASTVVIAGSGKAFTDVEPAVDFLQRVRPRYIIHHMTRPLAIGKLWDVIRNGPMTRDGIPDPDFLAVVIDADDLRAEGIPLSKSLSWESTAEDFVRGLGTKGTFDTLVTCPNLIVRFGTEGVIYHRGRDAGDPVLYYHPRKMESTHQMSKNSAMIDLASAFTAGLALGFADSKPPDCHRGIQYGISAASKLSAQGFVHSELDNGPDYPVAQIMEKLALDRQHTAVSIPSGRISSGDKWSIFDSVTGDPAELARHVVVDGPEKALATCPVQMFGSLLAVERAEQENLRSVLDAMTERLDVNAAAGPTSIGVVGPPGSGKKFVTANLATHVSAGRKVRKLQYNSQLLGSNELIEACHTIRDHTASGELTVVTFENFETFLRPSSQLLSEILTIMRDGHFSDKGHVHSLGAPLLFFIVNHDTAVDSDDTFPPPTPTSPRGADFAQRTTIDMALLMDHLHGLVKTTSINQIGTKDKMFCIRRAIMLRQLLKDKHPHLSSNGRLNVEEGVLHALLLVPKYNHGLRSLEKIISTSRLSGRKKFDVSALPPEEQIQLHVDGKTFMNYLRSPKLQPALREKLAEGMFEVYKKQRYIMCKNDREREALDSERSMRDWMDLPPELKESTRSQADDIPRKLRAVNCFMLNEERSEPLIKVPEFSVEQLDMLSEIEHERFNAERLQRQWRMGPRNSKQRTTPFLVPWRDLSQEWRDVDRVMVECVPRILEKAGWYIYRMKEEVEVNGTT